MVIQLANIVNRYHHFLNEITGTAFPDPSGLYEVGGRQYRFHEGGFLVGVGLDTNLQDGHIVEGQR